MFSVSLSTSFPTISTQYLSISISSRLEGQVEVMVHVVAIAGVASVSARAAVDSNLVMFQSLLSENQP